MFAIAELMGVLVFYAGLRLIVTGEQHWGVGPLFSAKFDAPVSKR